MAAPWKYYIRMWVEYGRFKRGNWSLRSWLVVRFGFIGLFGRVGPVVWNPSGRMGGRLVYEYLDPATNTCM